MIKILCILFCISISLYKASHTNIRGLQTILNVVPTTQNIKILGNAATYSVLAGSRITNQGNTIMFGDMGTYPSYDMDGDNCKMLCGSKQQGNSRAENAQISSTKAYIYLTGLKGTDYTGRDLQGLILYPGVYSYTSSAFLSEGILTLDAQGNSKAEWVFQIVSTLITSIGSEIRVINGGSPYNVYWKVGSSATISQDTKMVGNIIALTSITLESNISLMGRALAHNGAVTMVSVYVRGGSCN